MIHSKHVIASLMFVSLSLTTNAQNSLKKEEWLKRFKPAFTNALCKPGNNFLKCFKIDEATCKKQVEIGFKLCLARQPSILPNIITAETTRESGEQLGGCVGGTFDTEFPIDQTAPACEAVKNGDI